MADPAGAPPRALVLDPADNVAVAVADLDAGESVVVSGSAVTTAEAIRFGHKLAVTPIGAGDAVVKYHETIGIATRPIGAGEHVHVHNTVSSRLPGPAAGA